MNPDWTDFEKYVFEKLEYLTIAVSHLEGRAMVWGAIGGMVMGLASTLAIKILLHT